MEFLIIRFVLLLQFYCTYVIRKGDSVLVVGGILTILMLYLVFLNYNKFRFMLIFEAFVGLGLATLDPLIGCIFSISIFELILIKSEKIKFLGIITYLPVIFCSNPQQLVQIITLITIVNLFVYYRIHYRKVSELSFEERMDLTNKLYKVEEKLALEKESREQQLYNLKLEERNKISGKIHDKVGHIIVTSLMQLRASLIIMDNDKEKSRDMIESTIDILSEGINDIRETLKEVKPLYEEVGINKIKFLLDNKIKYSSFKHAFIYKGNLESIETEQWVIIMDGIKELTTNVLKYSSGDKLTIKLEAMKGVIKLVVRDNGENYIHYKKGMGLSSLEENILNLGGNLIINNEEGFEVNIILPVKGDNI